jgi:hypothetical protein
MYKTRALIWFYWVLLGVTSASAASHQIQKCWNIFSFCEQNVRIFFEIFLAYLFWALAFEIFFCCVSRAPAAIGYPSILSEKKSQHILTIWNSRFRALFWDFFCLSPLSAAAISNPRVCTRKKGKITPRNLSCFPKKKRKKKSRPTLRCAIQHTPKP